MAAAITAARTNRNLRIVLLEAQERCGRKLLSTGNGRCNISNSSTIDDDTRDFFAFLGIRLVQEEDGRLYPMSEQASSVLDMLRLKCNALGIEMLCSEKVSILSPDIGGFILSTDSRKILSRKVIVAAGGPAAPQLGGNDSGMTMLAALGHKLTTPTPSLCAVRVKSDLLRSLKGQRVKCRARLMHSGKCVAEECGEVLFAQDSLSGIAIFNLSRFIRPQNAKQYSICLTLCSLHSEQDEKMAALELLYEQKKALGSLTIEDFLSPLIGKRVGMALLKQCGISPLSRKVDSLSESELSRLASLLVCWKFEVSSLSDFKNSQSSCGGIATNKFSPDSFESLLHQGLYACGEVLDKPLGCGGYNLQWAWHSGICAGRNAATSLSKHSQL